MEQLTFSVAVAACVLVFCLPPVWWLVVYIAIVAWYPSYLTVKIGALDFSAARIVIFAIYISLFLRTDLIKRFRFNYLDALVITYFVSQFLAGVMTTDLLRLLENRSGDGFDTLLPYFAVRAIITDKQRYLSFLKGSMYVVAPLAIFGFYESWTSHNPAGFLKEYHAWGSLEGLEGLGARFGFYRAWFTFSHPIMFGLFFAILGPIWAGLLYQAGTNRLMCYAGIALACVGVFSSMSSGPALAALVAVAFIAFYRYKRHWKLVVIAIILMCATIEIISNRHFYHYLTRFMMSQSSAWYRGRLMDVALFEGGMSGHWLAGYGLATDDAIKAGAEWGAKIDKRDWADIVNEYLLIVFRFGLIALVPFLAMICAAFKRLKEAWKMSLSDADKWLMWCLSASMVGVLTAMNTVGLFGPPITLFFMTLAICCQIPALVAKPKPVHLRYFPNYSAVPT
jgi:hypothetical protein